MNDQVNGERIKQAREFCGLSQTELASRINVTQPAIAEIESNRFDPSEELVVQISFQTGFPISFFRLKQDIEVPYGSLLYRSRQDAFVKERIRMYRYAQIVYELFSRLQTLKHIKNIFVRIPIINNEMPSLAAQLTRSSLNLSPDKPIKQLINTLERAGVVILTLPIKSNSIKAFSFWVGSKDNNPTPVIVLIDGWPNDMVRFNVAHELGHLVLHSKACGSGGEVEDEAMMFAGEFLLPENRMREELIPPIKLSDLADLKLRWGVSMAAFIVRADRLGIITKRQYKYLMQQLSVHHWRENEPDNLQPREEKPRLLGQLAEMGYGIPIDIAKLASDAHLPSQLVEKVLSNFYLKEAKSDGTIRETKIFSMDSKKVVKSP